MDSFSKPGVLPTGTWRVVSEHFVPRATTSVTSPEKFTSRNGQIEIAVIIALLMGETEQQVLKIAKFFLQMTSYNVISPLKEAAA